jgi:hypothetical protein
MSLYLGSAPYGRRATPRESFVTRSTSAQLTEPSTCDCTRQHRHPPVYSAPITGKFRALGESCGLSCTRFPAEPGNSPDSAAPVRAYAPPAAQAPPVPRPADPGRASFHDHVQLGPNRRCRIAGGLGLPGGTRSGPPPRCCRCLLCWLCASWCGGSRISAEIWAYAEHNAPYSGHFSPLKPDVPR